MSSSDIKEALQLLEGESFYILASRFKLSNALDADFLEDTVFALREKASQFGADGENKSADIRVTIDGGESATYEVSVERKSTKREITFECAPPVLETSVLMAICRLIAEYRGIDLSPESDCFIASVCLRRNEEHILQDLRLFRDTILRHYSLGRFLVHQYYLHGPLLASWIERHNFMRTLIRIIFVLPCARLACLIVTRHESAKLRPNKGINSYH